MASDDCQKTSRASVLPGLILSAIILFEYGTFLTCHIIPLLSKQESSSSALMQLIGSHLVIIPMFICGLLSNITHPRSIPNTWPWNSPIDPSVAENLGIEKKTTTGKSRFCRTCGLFKPDRAHHCRVCNQCVLKMDHHCPWINNCVGFYNHKYFFLFLFYATLSIWVMIITTIPTYIDAIHAIKTITRDFVVVFSFFLACFLALPLTLFFLFHCWLIYNGFTTIEFCEKRRAPEEKTDINGVPLRSKYSESLFNQGPWKNFKSALGPNVLLWLIPTRSGMSNDGIKFPRNPMFVQPCVENKGEELTEDTDSGALTRRAVAASFDNPSQNREHLEESQKKNQSHLLLL